MTSEAQLRQQLATHSRRVWERGWVANHDGNLSLRLPRGRLLCTPTGVSKGDLTAEMMLVVDEGGRVLSGKLRPFSELSLHLAYYQARPDVGAVIHSHAPTATAFGVSGAALDTPFLPEAVVSLGPEVPTVPLTMPGGDAVRALGAYLADFDALLLAGNGVLSAGTDLEQAYLRMELVEHLCRIALAARQLGGPQPLPAEYLPPLLAARKRAGLGPESRGRLQPAPSRPPGPAPTRSAATDVAPNAVPDQGAPTQKQLETFVRDEIARVLGR